MRACISIHALLAESDRANRLAHAPPEISIHALLAESDYGLRREVQTMIDISIHALLAESDGYVRYCTHAPGISIHALLAESDKLIACLNGQLLDFYPRSPCGERLVDTLKLARPMLFLSTLSLRRATMDSSRAANCQHHFYPRSPCGERQHAYQLVLWVLRFLSTLSLRRATVGVISVILII